MSLSSYRAAPRKGHLQRAKRVVGYLSGMRHGVIRFRTGTPDHTDITLSKHTWDNSIYGNPSEAIPHDIPKALGKPVVLTAYVDANLYHDTLTGRSVTGTLHFMNQTPIHWYSKKPETVETATYSSEFVAA